MYLSHPFKRILTLVLLCLCLGSCGQGFKSLDEAPDQSATLTVYLTRPGQPDFAARTLVPQDTQDKYVRLTFSPEQEGPEPVIVATTGESAIARLSAGTWNISAQGWNTQGDYETTPDLVILKGQGRVQVMADEVKDALVILYPTGTGTGLLRYTVQVPSDTVSALLRVYTLPETAESPSYLLDLFAAPQSAGDSLTLTGELTLNTGFYRAALDISRAGAGMLRKNDTVHIYEGLTTPGTYTFTKDDFTQADAFTTLEALQTHLSALPENTPDTPYLITLTMPFSGLSQDEDSLRGLFAALSKRYVALDLKACTPGEETVITGTVGNAANPRNGQYLVSLLLPEGITSLGAYAFYSCSSLEYLSLPKTLTAMEHHALQGTGLHSLSIPQGVNVLGQGVFEGSALQSLDLSGLTLTNLGDRILASCPSLKQVSFPAALPGKTLPDNTFYQSTALESVSLPKNLEIIGIGAFNGCASLRDADLPPSLKTIKQQAFDRCALFTPDIGTLIALETLGDSAFARCQDLTTLSLPASITALGTGAFQSCDKLTLVELPESLAALIDYSTFRYCRKLQFKVGAQDPSSLLITADGTLRAYPGAAGAMSLPEGIKGIAAYCFYQDTGISSVSLPKSLESIGTMAFNGCTGLQELVCLAVTPPILGTLETPSTAVFTQTHVDLKIYVPDASLAAYKAAEGWKDLSSKIYDVNSRSDAVSSESNSVNSEIDGVSSSSRS
jgi:hypothetical protein